jgi:precorrin-6B C5,15-methyltransferase / cobalt-precorrin-6B C5,C15-methyltransferase
MVDPWLSIIGLGEDGLSGLTSASRAALDAAEIVFGGPRHLALADVGSRGHDWPIPFSVDPVLACRDRATVVLASGDPFWFGAGGSLAAHLAPGEWRAFPAPSTFSLAAARLGWRLEETLILGLHATPLQRLRPILAPGQRVIATLRDAAAVAELAAYLTAQGFGTSALHILECLGGPRERIRAATPATLPQDITAPVAVAIEPAGPALPRAAGLPDNLFANDGQITKRPVRALTLSALAPRPGETLWDIGTGSGSISIEWLLSAPATRAFGLEADTTRAARARANADTFGLAHRYTVTEAKAPDGLGLLPRPDAVFIGGGASEALLVTLWPLLPPGTRLVANAVTLESEALFTQWSATKGGTLLRIELAEAQPLGRKRGWQPMRPVVQWSVTR